MLKRYLFFGILIGSCFLSIPSYAKIHKFTVNEPRELDFATLDEVFRVRKKMVKSFPIFFSGTYEPTKSSAFREVVSGKLWWGVKGMACYGPGQYGIEGVSEESRFIDNPFSLISIAEDGAFPLKDGKESCPNVYSQLTALTFNDETRTFAATYNISKFKNAVNKVAAEKNTLVDFSFSLNGLNAVDFGLLYGYVQSHKNITFKNNNNISKQPHRFLDYIHVGGSCGYSGGCNNGSPNQPAIDFKINQFPAQINLKLWKKEPKSKDDAPFITYKITIK